MKFDLIGKWVQNEEQAFPGLTFVFNENGSFEATYDPMGIVSGGTWDAEGNVIKMDQTHHTFELIGKFVGIYEIEGDQLKMALVTEDLDMPQDFDQAVHYTRA